MTSLGIRASKTPSVRVAMVNCNISHLCHFFQIRALGTFQIFPAGQEGGGKEAFPIAVAFAYLAATGSNVVSIRLAIVALHGFRKLGL